MVMHAKCQRKKISYELDQNLEPKARKEEWEEMNSFASH